VGSNLALGFFSVSSNGVLAYRTGGSGLMTQITWLDRQGKMLGVVGTPAAFGGLSLSPDGRRLAVERLESTGQRQNIWILDVARGLPSRLTFDEALDNSPVWSPDGTKLFYTSARSGSSFDIYQKDSNGSGNEELLLKTEASSARTGNWSSDGRYFVYAEVDAKTRSDLWVYSAPERKSTPYLQSPAGEAQGQFSPNGRWIAYSSDDSGEYQIFVKSFPDGASKFQISTSGGTQPRWRKDGKELFYIAADGRMMATGIKTSPKFESAAPEALFPSRLTQQVNIFRYDVAHDGNRFLMNIAAGYTSAEAPITVVLNWQAAIKTQ
jgi:Tol biopolymer transport system component